MIAENQSRIDPLDLLARIYGSRAAGVDHLDTLVSLVERNVFYSEKKRIHAGTEIPSFIPFSEKAKMVSVFRSTLLEYDLVFHRTFVRTLMDEEEDIREKYAEPYKDNKEYLFERGCCQHIPGKSIPFFNICFSFCKSYFEI